MALRTHALAAIGALLCAGAASGASWRPVPGAPDIDIDLASVEFEGARVAVWLRTWGRSPLAPEAATHGLRPGRIHRTALRTEFDCGKRTMRVLAASAYDSSGAPLSSSGFAGPLLPVTGGDLGWTYDAVCEAARSVRRL